MPRAPAWFRGVRDRAAFYAVLAVFGLSFLSTSVVGAGLVWVLPGRWRAPVGRAIMRQGFRLCLGAMRATGMCTIEASALDALADARGLVIAPNHHSLLDVLLIVSRVPNVVCVTKASLWDNLFLGGMVRLAGFIRNDAPLKLVRAAALELEAGANLLIFPEGTRAPPGAPMGVFRPGFALMAKAAGAPIQMVLIEANTPYLQKGWPLLRRPALPLAYRVRLGPQIVVGPGPVTPLVARLEQDVRDALGGGAVR